MQGLTLMISVLAALELPSAAFVGIQGRHRSSPTLDISLTPSRTHALLPPTRRSTSAMKHRQGWDDYSSGPWDRGYRNGGYTNGRDYDAYRRPEPSSDNLKVGTIFNENDQSQRWNKRPRQRTARNDNIGVGSVFGQVDQSRWMGSSRNNNYYNDGRDSYSRGYSNVNYSPYGDSSSLYSPSSSYRDYGRDFGRDYGRYRSSDRRRNSGYRPPEPSSDNLKVGSVFQEFDQSSKTLGWNRQGYRDSYNNRMSPYSRGYSNVNYSPYVDTSLYSSTSSLSRPSVGSGYGGMTAYSSPDIRSRRSSSLSRPGEFSYSSGGGRQAYDDWCRKYGKRPSERGFSTFSRNKRDLDEYNRRTGSRLRLNAYSDLTESEFERLKSRELSPDYLDSLRSASPLGYGSSSSSLNSLTSRLGSLEAEGKRMERMRQERLERQAQEVQRKAEAARQRISEAQATISYRRQLTEEEAAEEKRRLASEAARLKAEVETKKMEAEEAKRRYQLEQTRIAAETQEIKRKVAAEQRRLADARKRITSESERAIKRAAMERKRIAMEQSRLYTDSERRRKEEDRRRRLAAKDEERRWAEEERERARSEKDRLVALRESQRQADIDRKREEREQELERKRLERDFRARQQEEQRERSRLLREQERQAREDRLSAEREMKRLFSEDQRGSRERARREAELVRIQLADERRLTEERMRRAEYSSRLPSSSLLGSGSDWLTI